VSIDYRQSLDSRSSTSLISKLWCLTTVRKLLWTIVGKSWDYRSGIQMSISHISRHLSPFSIVTAIFTPSRQREIVGSYGWVIDPVCISICVHAWRDCRSCVGETSSVVRVHEVTADGLDVRSGVAIAFQRFWSTRWTRWTSLPTKMYYCDND